LGDNAGARMKKFAGIAATVLAAIELDAKSRKLPPGVLAIHILL
jgi:hypothetical protein